MSFVSLHTHSDHSLHDGFQSVETILSYCSSMGQTAVALTDHGTMTGCGEGFRLHDKYGIKFIAGCEHYLCNDVTIKDKNLNHIILLAMNKEGYRNLNILTTLAHSEDNFYFKPRLDLSLLEKYNAGIICSTACLAGCQSRAKELKEIFGDRLYIEIHTNSMQEQKDKNLEWLDIADKYGINFYAAVDAHYTIKEQARFQERWTPYDYSQMPPDFYLHSEQEVYDALSYLPQDIVEHAVQETQAVADRCTFDLKFGENHYPKSPYKDPKYEVRMRTWAGCKEHGIAHDQKHIEQIRHELDVLEKVDYFDYFLIVSDMINWCKEHGIRTGVGRGSVVGCDIAYNMGITRIDPLANGLIFERFAHTERVTPPDIDTDVPRSKRKDVIQYLVDTYGHVYQVVTFNKMAEKAAIRRAAMAFNLPAQTVNEICNKFDSIDTLDQTKEEDYEGNPFLPMEFDEFKGTVHQFFGKLQNFGTHASAVVVLTTYPYDYCAIERFSGSKGAQYNLNYEFHDLEAMGLLKLDILGLETLDLIDNTLAQIPEDKRPDMDNLPDGDWKAYDCLMQKYRGGLFQVEGKTIGNVLHDINPSSLSELTAVVALGRPGPLDAGETQAYITSKKTGVLATIGSTSCLREFCSDTYGCMIYQEQVMKIVRGIWNTSMGEADMIRRACARKDPELMKKLIAELKNRPHSFKYSDDEIERVLNKINKASGYLFNKSHSVAYAYTAYETAYLKGNYPLEFYTALLNSNVNQDKKKEYMNEVAYNGIGIKFPDIVQSDVEFTHDENSIIVGLAYIRGVGNINIVKPTTNTADGLKEFLDNNRSLNKQVCVNLIKAGCFSCNPKWAIDYVEWFKKARARQDQCEERIQYYESVGKEKMAQGWYKKLELIPNPPEEKDYSGIDPKEKREMQVEVMGESNVYLFQSYSHRLVSHGNRMVWVTSIREFTTKKGKDMYIVTGQTEGTVLYSRFLFFNPSKDLFTKLIHVREENMYIIRCSRTAKGGDGYWATDIIEAKPLQ